MTSFVLGFCFLVLRPCYLHQFVYIYPPVWDSGGMSVVQFVIYYVLRTISLAFVFEMVKGEIWMRFIQILLPCMIIAECTIAGLMGLKQSDLASTMMIRK